MSEAATHEDILRRLDVFEGRFETAVGKMALQLDEHRDIQEETRVYLFGGTTGPGLAELVRQHERWIGVQRRLLLVLVPSILLGCAAVVWQAVAASIARAG